MDIPPPRSPRDIPAPADASARAETIGIGNNSPAQGADVATVAPLYPAEALTMQDPRDHRHHGGHWIRAAVALAALAALALVLAPPTARADDARTGDEPWYGRATADARQRAKELFEQAVDMNQQLLRGEAKELYEQALALWDNPKIRWNLAVVLEDLGQYLPAYEHLASALEWGAALGPERLREVRERMLALEATRLARIETVREEPGAVITLDGKPWRPQAGRRSAVVLPGEHYVAARKPGYYPVTRSVVMKSGERARVAVPMDADRIYETRRWSAWKPWAVVGAGIAVTAVGAALERRAAADWDAADERVQQDCMVPTCTPSPAKTYDAAGAAQTRAIATLAAGGVVVTAGLAMAWVNRARAQRTEARPPARIELTPILSRRGAELSARVRF